MGPRYDGRESQPEPTTTREPLVEIDVPPLEPDEPRLGVQPRRKRLSDTATEADGIQPPTQAKPQRPRLPETHESDADVPPPQPQPEPRRPRLVDVTAAPEGPESRLRAARPRLVLTQPEEEMPGLQNIIDPPSAVTDVATLGRTGAARSAELLAKRSFSVAAVGGLTAAVVGAMVWALIAAATNWHLGFLAMGVGLLIGGVIRVLGRGTNKSFGHLGAVVSAFGCLLGALLSVCTVIASQEGLSPLAVVTHICTKPALIPGAMLATFQSMDLLFYGVALYVGYRLSFRPTPEA